MSYNCDNIEVLASTATIARADVLRLAKELGDRLPESNFIEQMAKSAPEALCAKGHPLPETAKFCPACGSPRNEASAPLAIQSFDWCGEGSGHSFDAFTEEVLPCTKGRAELVLTWEGGDSVSGLIVDNGKVMDCDVKYTLVPRKAK